MAEEVAVSTETAKEPPVVDPAGAPETTTAEKPAEEPRTYTQEEMDRITAKVKKNASYRARKEAEAYYKGLQQGTEIAKPEPAPVPATEAKPPERASFDTYEAFLDAKADWTGRRAAREERVKGEHEEKTRLASEAKAKLYQDFQSKVRTEFPDIEERLAEIGHVNMPAGMGDAIAESALGPKILSFLADHPKDCERIAALSSSAAIREIGKLEARLELAATPPKEAPQGEPEAKAEPGEEPKAKPSNAPEPITPVGGKATDTNAEPSPDKDGGKAWIDWRNRQVLARRTGAKLT